MCGGELSGVISWGRIIMMIRMIIIIIMMMMMMMMIMIIMIIIMMMMMMMTGIGCGGEGGYPGYPWVNSDLATHRQWVVDTMASTGHLYIRNVMQFYD